MEIELITQEDYEKISAICNDFPALILENKGYEYIPKSKLTEEEKNKIKEVEEILSKHITGFSNFSNFRLNNTEKIQIRFQYDWTAHDRSLGIPFTGVGYIFLDQLLNGFDADN